MKVFLKLFFFCLLIILSSRKILANNNWIIDKELSEIKFEIPVLLTNNVNGRFNEFEGYVFIDKKNRKNNRALFSVQINSMVLNYNKYKELLFSNIFFEEVYFPVAVLDTKIFTLSNKLTTIEIKAELQIKNIVQIIPLIVNINQLSNNFVHIKANTKFSRNSYQLGKGSWSSTLILRDRVSLIADLFLYRE